MVRRGKSQSGRFSRRLPSGIANTSLGAAIGKTSRIDSTRAIVSAIGAGMTSAIMNPLHVETVRACLGADVMMGHDPHCERWIARFREQQPPGAEGAAVRGRREGRRAARA